MILVVYGSRTKIQVPLDNKTIKSLFMASSQYGCLTASEWQEGSKSLLKCRHENFENKIANMGVRNQFRLMNVVFTASDHKLDIVSHLK